MTWRSIFTLGAVVAIPFLLIGLLGVMLGAPWSGLVRLIVVSAILFVPLAIVLRWGTDRRGPGGGK